MNALSTPRPINVIHHNLISRIHECMPWSRIHTHGGRTQDSENEYIHHLKDAILREGGIITGYTGTQQSRDIRGVQYPGFECLIDYEGKKINGRTGSFCLNDTLPKGENLYYIFLRVGGQSVDIRKATELTDDEHVTYEHYTDSLDALGIYVDRMRLMGSSVTVSNFQELFKITVKLLEVAVKSRLLSLYDYGQLFKFSTTFGFFKSRPRPNWFLSTKVLDQEFSPQPVELVVEEQHSPIEQPDPLGIPPSHSPSETLESA